MFLYVLYCKKKVTEDNNNVWQQCPLHVKDPHHSQFLEWAFEILRGVRTAHILEPWFSNWGTSTTDGTHNCF